MYYVTERVDALTNKSVKVNVPLHWQSICQPVNILTCEHVDLWVKSKVIMLYNPQWSGDTYTKSIGHKDQSHSRYPGQ